MGCDVLTIPRHTTLSRQPESS